MRRPEIRHHQNRLFVSIPFEVKNGAYVWGRIQVRLYANPAIYLGDFQPYSSLKDTQFAVGDSLEVNAQVSLSPLAKLLSFFEVNVGTAYATTQETSTTVFQYDGRSQSSDDNVYYSFTIDLKYLNPRTQNDTRIQEFVWEVAEDDWPTVLKTLRLEVGSLDQKSRFQSLLEPLTVTIEDLFPKLSESQEKIVHNLDNVALLLSHEEDTPSLPDVLIGREEKLLEITHALTKRKSVLIQGFIGSGKTAILSEWVYRRLKENPNRKIVWLEAGQMSIDGWINAFSHLLTEIEKHELIGKNHKQQLTIILKSMRDQNVQIIALDDVWDGGALEILRKSLPHSIALAATSRKRLALATIVDLPNLAPEDSFALLEYYAGEISEDHRLSAVELCTVLLDNLPFAIEIAGKMIHTQNVSSTKLVRQIRDKPHHIQTPLSTRKEKHPTIAHLIEASLDGLDSSYRDFFISLGAYPAPLFHSELIGLYPVDIAPLTIDEILDYQTKIDVNPNIRIDALQNLVNAQLLRLDVFDGYFETISEMLEKFYLLGLLKRRKDQSVFEMPSLAFSYAKSLHIATPATEKRIIETIHRFVVRYSETSKHNMDIVEALLPTILESVRLAFKLDLKSVGLDIINNLYNGLYGNGHILSLRGYSAEAYEMIQLAVDASKEIGDLNLETVWLGNLASVLKLRGQYDKAINTCSEAINISRSIQDRFNEGRQLGIYADVLTRQGKFDEAIHYYANALVIKEALKDQQGILVTLNNLGILYERLGKKMLALSYYFRAIHLAEQSTTSELKSIWDAMIWANLGKLYLFMGLLNDADTTLKRSLELSEQSGNEPAEMYTHQWLSLLAKVRQDHSTYHYHHDKFLQLAMKHHSEKIPDSFELHKFAVDTAFSGDEDEYVHITMSEFLQISTVTEMIQFVLFCPDHVLDRIISFHERGIDLLSHAKNQINERYEALNFIREKISQLNKGKEETLKLATLVRDWKKTRTWREAEVFLTEYQDVMCTSGGFIMLTMYGTVNDDGNRSIYAQQKLHEYLLDQAIKIDITTAFKNFYRLYELVLEWMRRLVPIEASQTFYQVQSTLSEPIVEHLLEESRTLHDGPPEILINTHLILWHDIQSMGLNDAYIKLKMDISKPPK